MKPRGPYGSPATVGLPGSRCAAEGLHGPQGSSAKRTRIDPAAPPEPPPPYSIIHLFTGGPSQLILVWFGNGWASSGFPSTMPSIASALACDSRLVHSGSPLPDRTPATSYGR